MLVPHGMKNFFSLPHLANIRTELSSVCVFACGGGRNGRAQLRKSLRGETSIK